MLLIISKSAFKKQQHCYFYCKLWRKVTKKI